MTNFKMSADGLHRTLVPVVLVLVAASTVSTVAATAVGPVVVRVIVLSAMALAWGSLVVALAWGPREVVVGPHGFSVRRAFGWPLRVEAGDIEAVEPGPGFHGERMLRLFGCGGFAASYGLFWTRSLGRFRLYTRKCRGPTVLVRRRAALPLVLGADDAQGLEQALSALRR